MKEEVTIFAVSEIRLATTNAGRYIYDLLCIEWKEYLLE
jgi:hypothetical protein